MATIRDNLKYFAKDRLAVLYFYLLEHPAPARATKAVLIEKIANAYADPDSECILLAAMYVGRENLLVLKPYLSYDSIPDSMVKTSAELTEAFCRLNRVGLAHKGSGGWTICPEYVASVQQLDDSESSFLLYFSFLIGYTEDLLFTYYGMLPEKDLFALLAICCKDTSLPDPHKFDLMRYFFFDDVIYHAKNDQYYICSEDLDDPEDLYKRLQELPEDLPLADVSALISLKNTQSSDDKDWSTIFPSIAPIKQWLIKQGFDKDEALYFLRVLLYETHNNNPDAVYEMLYEAGIDRDLNAKENLMFQQAIRGLPMWSFRGHTAEEMEAFRTKQAKNQSPKVGRNDPCPCGSGRKYKNCCGRFQ
ncbi:MAG: SEC-C metal-binding domain-containing protein [Clostridia bacterium]|nr:SEC-C metal-binding domain-containing protein [Clostridia bacterium]